MSNIRIATFNIENLLQRFNFHSYGRLTTERVLRLLDVKESDEEYFTLRKSLAIHLTDDSRQQAAQAICDTKADIVCLQEIDNRQILDDFHDYYLERTTGTHYGWRRLLEGNDIRGIDVAVMSKIRIIVESHKDHTFDEFDLFNSDLRDYGFSEGDSIFRRDCLEVNLTVGAKPLTLFVCHFKSMSGGRTETCCIREAESKAVKKIIENKFGVNPSNSDWIILGDLNDYILHNGNPDPNHGLKSLFEGGFSVNLLDRIPVTERWTHYYPKDGSKHQIDYILASQSLTARNPNTIPDIIRAGQPYRVPGISDLKRYPRIGFDRPKASDHCAIAVTLDI